MRESRNISTASGGAPQRETLPRCGASNGSGAPRVNEPVPRRESAAAAKKLYPRHFISGCPLSSSCEARRGYDSVGCVASLLHFLEQRWFAIRRKTANSHSVPWALFAMPTDKTWRSNLYPQTNKTFFLARQVHGYPWVESVAVLNLPFFQRATALELILPSLRPPKVSRCAHHTVSCMSIQNGHCSPAVLLHCDASDVL